MIGVGVQGIDEPSPPPSESGRLDGVQDRLRLGVLTRSAPLVGQHLRQDRVAARHRFGQAIKSANKAIHQPDGQAIEDGLRSDAQFAQTVFQLIQATCAAWMRRLHQAVHALLAVAEIPAAGFLLKPQVHLRAEGEIIVDTIDHFRLRIMLAGQAEKRDGDSFQVVEMDHIEWAVFA